ncbi:MAG: hypothetical protein ACRBEE_04390 [Arenicella sp.]
MPIKERFDELSSQIRNGEMPDKPSVVYQFIHFGHQWALSQPEVSDKRVIYERMFHTLLDTICDPLIESHWRHTCLDNIHQPLNNIHKLARTCCECRHAHELHHEVSVTSQYFL